MALKIAIQIENSDSADHFIYANPTVINYLNLPLHKPFKLSFGNKSVDVQLGLSSNKGNLVRIPAHVAQQLMIPNGIQIYAKYHKDYGIQLGPIIGILVQNILNNQPQTPFGKLTLYMQEVAQVARSNGILAYIFALEDINQEEGYVNGWIYKNNKWVKGKFPIPNVVYNRISSRMKEKKSLELIKNLQKKYRFTFFNEHFLNKWQVYEKLINTPIENIMPKTVLYKGVLTLKQMLSKHQQIYLKPTNGALGRGIIRIEKINNQYTVKFSRNQSPMTITFTSIGSLYKYLKPRLANETFLVQKGLNLIHHQNRPIDFRILVQKNGLGKWAITSMVARIANDQHIVSNLARGGTQSGVMETIKLASPKLATQISRTHFKKLALAVASNLELATEGNFAELGIDLALDESGKIWLLEVNSKPSKSEDTSTKQLGPRPSVRRLIQYVLHISDYQQQVYTKRKRRIRSGGS